MAHLSQAEHRQPWLWLEELRPVLPRLLEQGHLECVSPVTFAHFWEQFLAAGGFCEVLVWYPWEQLN